LDDGDNHVEIDLTNSTWNSEAAGWTYTGTLSNTDAVQEILLIFYPTAGWEGQSSVYLDNVRLYGNAIYYGELWDDAHALNVTSPETPTIKAHALAMSLKAWRECPDCYFPLMQYNGSLAQVSCCTDRVYWETTVVPQDRHGFPIALFLGALGGFVAVPTCWVARHEVKNKNV
jgi:hypothetical protein